jgi:hypothetical protein
VKVESKKEQILREVCKSGEKRAVGGGCQGCKKMRGRGWERK